MKIGVIDYRVGNIGSILNMLSRCGANAIIVSDASDLNTVDKLILPGVGHFDHGVRQLKAHGFFDHLAARAADSQPLLGICLGMQLLMSSSEEGEESGLGLIPGTCRKFVPTDRYKVPHMGWNVVEPTHEGSALSQQAPESRYYFVHSYYADPEEPAHCAGTTTYIKPFCSSVQSENNVIGYQFHPEKSHRFGMQLLRGFAGASSCL